MNCLVTETRYTATCLVTQSATLLACIKTLQKNPKSPIKCPMISPASLSNASQKTFPSKSLPHSNNLSSTSTPPNHDPLASSASIIRLAPHTPLTTGAFATSTIAPTTNRTCQITPTMTLPNLLQPQTGDPLPPLSSICLLRSSHLLSQPSMPQLPEYLGSSLLLSALQYLSEKTPPPSINSFSLDDSPHDLSRALLPCTTWTPPPTMPSSMDWSSPWKHTHTNTTKPLLPRKRPIRRSWMTLVKPLSSLRPALLDTLTPSANHPTGILRTANSLISPFPAAMDSPTQPSGSSSSMMAVSLAIQRKMVLTTFPMSARFMQCPNTQLTLQSLYPIGSTKPFKGQPLAILSSLMQSRAQTIGASKPMLCGTEISMNASSTTKPSLTTPTANSRVPSLLMINVKAGWSVHNFPNGFHIWWENPCACPPISVLGEDGRKDMDVTSKGECDVIDLTNEDSSSDDEEL